jgi:hypothetical protein
MRILNIVFNAKIKYQQYEKLRKYRHKEFRSNFDPEKTHKGKTSERGICIIYELLRNSFNSIFIFRYLHKLIWTFLQLFSSISEPEIRTTVRKLMMYGLSRNSCQNSAKIQFLCHSMLFGSLGMHANTPRNFSCCLFL